MVTTQTTEPILVIAPWLPRPDRQGGCRRLAHLLRFLRAYGPVEIYAQRADAEAYDGAYSRYRGLVEADGVRVLDHSANALDAALKARRYRAIWCEFWVSAESYLPRLRYYQPGVPILVDCVDLGYRRLEASPGPLSAAQVARERQRELDSIAACDWIVTVSDEERALLGGALPGRADAMTTLPIIFEPQPADPRPQEVGGRLLFVGSMLHAPNVDAARWLAADILPRIRARRPDATLSIVGEPPREEALFPNGVPAGVADCGWAADLRPHLDAAQISVAPLRYGAGMKSKVIEAFASGPAVVTTPIGVQGIDVVSGCEALVTPSDDADAFANAVVSLLTDSNRRDAMRRAARAYVNRTCSPQRVQTDVGAMLTQLDSLPVARMRGLSRPAFASWYAAVRLRRALHTRIVARQQAGASHA